MTDPLTARLCGDCNNLVTTENQCPSCQKPTIVNPFTEGLSQSYCVDCADGPIEIEQMHLVTWDEDPHTQFDDGDIVTVCKQCHQIRERE